VTASLYTIIISVTYLFIYMYEYVACLFLRRLHIIWME